MALNEDECRYLKGQQGTGNTTLYTIEDTGSSQTVRRSGSAASTDNLINVIPEDRVGIVKVRRRKWFVIEFFQFIYLLGVYGTSVASHNLYLDKSCRLIMNYSQEVCNNLTSYPTELNQVQRHGNNYSMYVTLIGLLPAAVVSIFVSNWSDKFGKKAPMILAVSGILTLDVGFLVNGLLSNLPLYSIVIFAVPSGLTGGYLTLNTCVYSFISEKSSDRTRTCQHAAMEVVLLAAIPLGTFIGGLLYDLNGYKFTPVFLFVVATHVFCIIYALIALSEPRISMTKTSLSMIVQNFFGFSNIKSCYKTCLKRRDNYGRSQIWLLITAMCVASLAYSVPTDQILFYFCNKMYGWDMKHYSYVSAVLSAVTIVVLSVSTFLFTLRWQVRDVVLGIMGVLSLMAQNICRSLAVTEWSFYLSMALGVFGGFTDVTVRSKISKIVSKEEMGKVFMLYSILVCTTPVVGAVIVTQIYNASLAFFPGLYFAISVVWLLFPLGVFSWIYFLESRRS